MNNPTSDFPIEFHNEITDTDLDLFGEAETHLRQIARGNHDITGATVVLTQTAQGRTTPYIYEATVTLWMRPHAVAARAQGPDLVNALKTALHQAERQAREQRSKLRDQARTPQA